MSWIGQEMGRKAGLFLTTIVVVAVAIFGILRPRLFEPREIPLEVLPDSSGFGVLPCRGQSVQWNLRFRGKLALNRRFLADDPQAQDQQAHEAIRRQLMYLEASLSYDPRFAAIGQFYASGPSAEISDIRVEHGSYNAQFSLDSLEDVGKFAYLQAALKSGKTEAQDPAIWVSYDAKVPVASCIADPKSLSRFAQTVDLPLDPYLEFWMVPKLERRMRHFHQTKSRTNPCADPEMADVKFPSYYFYSWSPREAGTDDDGRSFRCDQWLREGVHYFSVAASWDRVIAPDLGPPLAELVTKEQKAHVIHASVIMGTLDPWSKKLDTRLLAMALSVPEFSAKLSAKHPSQLTQFDNKLDPIQAAHQVLLKRQVNASWDPGAIGMLRLLDQLRDVITVDSHQLLVSPDSLVILLRGKLRESLRRFELRISYGITNEDTPQGAKHWRELARALREDDLIFYLGHSGMGLNLSLETLSERIGMSPQEILGKRYRFLAFLSCRAYGLYYSDWAKAFSRDSHMDFLTMSTSEYLYLAPVSVLRYLDLLTIGKNPSLGHSLSWSLMPSTQLVLSRF